MPTVQQALGGRGGLVHLWGGSKNVRAQRRQGIRFNFLAARPWLVNFDARVLVEFLSNMVARRTYRALQAGEDLFSGISRPAPKKRGGTRFVRTGKFLASVTRRKIRGNAQRSRSTTSGSSRYRGALRAEYQRGHRYFRTDGLVGEEMRRELGSFVSSGLAGKLAHKGPNVAPRRASDLL